MARYVALLRGINVGGHRVKMDRLKELFEELNLDDVSTFIASGNVIFSTDSKNERALTGRIEQHLLERLGYEVATFLRSPAQLEAISLFEPPTAVVTEIPVAVYVMLLRDGVPDELRTTLVGLESATDSFRFIGSEVYWCIQGKISESPLFAREMDRALKGIVTTSRTLNTIHRLVAKLGS